MAAAVALAAGLAACGGSGDLERFRTEQLRPVVDGVEADRASIARVIDTLQLGNERDARQLGGAIDRLAARADDVRALDAPEEAAVPAARFADAIDALADRLRAYAGAIAQGSRSAARAGAARAQEAVDLLVRRRLELDQAVTEDA